MYRWLILLVALCGCAAVPARVVDELVSAKMSGEFVDTSGGWPETTVPFIVYDHMGNTGYDLTSGKGEQVWVQVRFGPFTDELREYQFVNAGLNQDSTGCVFTGVFDYAHSKWRWQDMSKTYWYSADREWALGFNMASVEQPLSPEGYINFIVVSYGGATIVHSLVEIKWLILE